MVDNPKEPETRAPFGHMSAEEFESQVARMKAIETRVSPEELDGGDSGPGIVSAIIGAVPWISVATMFLLGILVDGNCGDWGFRGTDSGTWRCSWQDPLLQLTIFAFILTLPGGVLAIVGLCQRHRRKRYAILGLVLNVWPAALLALVVVVLALGFRPY